MMGEAEMDDRQYQHEEKQRPVGLSADGTVCVLSVENRIKLARFNIEDGQRQKQGLPARRVGQILRDVEPQQTGETQ